MQRCIIDATDTRLQAMSVGVKGIFNEMAWAIENS
jgi:hypothetical protein